MRFGLDYAWTTISPAAHRAVGSSFACRYLSNDPSKNLSKGEAQALEAGGISIAVVWESVATRALDGRAAGQADARTALAQAQSLGMPGGRPIYFAVDFDEAPNQAAAVASYFAGVHDVLDNAGPVSFPTPVPVGVYGGYWVVRRLFDAKLVEYGWQSYAWSGGQWDPRAQIRQFSNGHLVAGQSCDYNHAVTTDFGQWDHAPAPGPPPTPTPIPTPPEDTVAITSAVNQDGRLEVFVELASGEVKHIAQDAANANWWKNTDGTFNWLSLGNPGK